jgi:hypothetical protein
VGTGTAVVGLCLLCPWWYLDVAAFELSQVRDKRYDLCEDALFEVSNFGTSNIETIGSILVTMREGKIEQISSLSGGYVSCGFNKDDVKFRSSITSVIASEGTPRLEREKYVSSDGFK